MGQAAIIPANAGFLQKNLETINACNSLAYFINPFCWGYSREAWSQMAQFSAQAATIPEPTPPSAVPAAYGSTAAPYTQAEYQAALDAAIAAGSDATTAARLLAAQGMTPVCGSGQALADDGVTCVDVTTSWWIYGALALVAVFAVVSLGGGSARRYGR
jgi:hypothetical protein